jgi:hypothetical protein
LGLTMIPYSAIVSGVPGSGSPLVKNDTAVA